MMILLKGVTNTRAAIRGSIERGFEFSIFNVVASELRVRTSYVCYPSHRENILFDIGVAMIVIIMADVRST
jgi:hypothetical protein